MATWGDLMLITMLQLLICDPYVSIPWPSCLKTLPCHYRNLGSKLPDLEIIGCRFQDNGAFVSRHGIVTIDF
ncbi:hypothetical protein ES332_D12G067500v1 [Gossypium tomentosum]|uniref:Secreted protein n=1 Tax=Gossypium tomentosum TaxID=34277 RepID=A0A5D2I5G6_GOSTO|nr:hypothetical protein ES332_D12G067500v1 [Gossypium tomentosum]